MNKAVIFVSSYPRGSVAVVFQTDGRDVAAAMYPLDQAEAAIEMWEVKGAVLHPLPRPIARRIAQY